MIIETKSTYSLILSEEEKELFSSILNYLDEESINEDLYELVKDMVTGLVRL